MEANPKMKETVMLLLELLLTGVVIIIQPTKTQHLDHMLTNATVNNSLSLDNFYNQTADQMTSSDTFPEVPENVTSKSLILKQQTTAGSNLPDSLNTSAGDQNQSLISTSEPSVSPPTTQDPLTSDTRTTSHSGQRVVRSLLDPILEDAIEHHQSLQETADDANEGEVSVSDGSSYVPYSEDDFPRFILDGDNDLYSKTSDVIGLSSADDIDDVIHLLSPNDVDDVLTDTSDDIDLAKLEDEHLISDVIHDILSNDKNMAESASGPVHIFAPENNIAASNDIHVFTGGAQSLNLPFKMNSLQNSDINMALNALDEGSNNVDMSLLSNILKAPYHDTVEIPSLDTTYSKDMTMDSLHDDNENNVVLALGDDDMMLNDISTPSLHHISVETYNNDIDNNRHSSHVNDVLNSIESSETLYTLPEKLRSLLQQPSQLVDQIHYLPQNVNAYKSPGKQERTRNSVYSLADNSMWTRENLLNLFGQQFDTSLSTRRENSQPLKMPPYISEPNNEINNDGELYLPVRTEIIKKSIGFNILRDLRPKNQYDTHLITKVPWLQIIKTPIKRSTISKSSPQNLAPTSGAGNVKGLLETLKPEYFQSVLSLVESLPLKEKEYISRKINNVLKMYRNIIDGKWRQLIPTTTKDIRMLAPHVQLFDLFNSNKTVTSDIGENIIHTNHLFTLILDLLKFGYNKSKVDKNSNNVTGDKKFEPTSFSRSESITEWPRLNADESKLVKPFFRSKRSRDWPLGDVSSINHKFRNKKLFLTQQFQIMRHEKSQVSRQMAGVDNKMNQVLPWGISVQSEVQDLSEADSLQPPSLSLDSEEDKSDVVSSKDTELKVGHDEPAVARIKNQSEIIFSTNSTNITEENSLRSMVNETFPMETSTSNQTYKYLNLSHVETQTNSKNKRTLIDNIKSEDKINDTNSSNKTFMNDKNTEIIKTVIPGEEHVTEINTATRKPIGFVSMVSKSNNISSENSSIATEKSLSLHNTILEGQNETNFQSNSSQMLRMSNNDQSKRIRRDINGPVPSWVFHSTTKQSPTIRTVSRLQPVTTRPSLRGQSSSPEQKYSNSQEQHAGNDIISQSKLDDTRQAPPTKHTSNFATDIVEIQPIEDTRARLSDSQPRPQDTPIRSVDTKTTTESYINRYLREKQNAEKLSRKRDVVKVKSSVTKNQEVAKSKPANLNKQPGKMSSYPVFNSQHLQSFISDSQVGERSGASYSHKFVQSKSSFQPETQSIKSNDLTDNSQRDKYKVPALNGINTGDSREAPMQQISNSETNIGQPQDLTSFEGGMLNMMPPESVVVHYQPVITYYTPPIHYSQIPEYLDFTARLLTPQLPGQRDPSTNEAGLEKESQLKTDPDTDEPTMNDPDLDLSVSVKSDDEDDLKVKVIEDIQSSKYESNDDQKLSQTKQESNQRTSMKESRIEDWKTENSQKTYIPENNNWEEENSYTNYENRNRYQNTQSKTRKFQVSGYQQQNQRAWNKNPVPLNQQYYDTNLSAQNGNFGKNRNYATKYNTKNRVRWYDSSRWNQNNQQSSPILKSPTNEFDILLQFTEPEKTKFKQSNAQDYSGSSNYYQTIDSSRGQGTYVNKQSPKVQQFSNENDRDEEAVLDFVYSQKNMNLGQSGMTGSSGMDDSSSSNYYQIIDSSSDRAGQAGEDKMIDAVVEHYIYTNPKYGYKRTENKKD